MLGTGKDQDLDQELDNKYLEYLNQNLGPKTVEAGAESPISAQVILIVINVAI